MDATYACCMVSFFTTYYTIFLYGVGCAFLYNHNGYLAIYRYFRNRHGYGRLKAFIYVYINHFRFGQIIIDRFAMYAGKHFEMEIEGQDMFDELDNSDDGFIQLSSHVGNYELAGYSLC